MAQKGQLKPPVVPLQQAFTHAMDWIDSCDGTVAVFMVGGKVICTKSKSAAYKGNLTRLASGLVGVYDQGVDARCLLADLNEFYKNKAAT